MARPSWDIIAGRSDQPGSRSQGRWTDRLPGSPPRWRHARETACSPARDRRPGEDSDQPVTHFPVRGEIVLAA